jgi:hypothetical protein
MSVSAPARLARLFVAISAIIASVVMSPATARATTSVTVTRGGPAATQTITTSTAGEGILDVSASAPGVSWGIAGAESAVVSISVDGHYQSDLVVMSSSPVARSVALGHLDAGAHTIGVAFADDRSPAGATSATLDIAGVRVVATSDAENVALANAPILYGRMLSKKTPFENATTDTPLLAWHEATPAATPGHTVLEYSVVWSNEDGGTSPPALMARWGRTTDIEWIYRVEVDGNGTIVPGTAVYQGANHATKSFGGTYEGAHPVLETCTSNNNVCDSKIADPMRFALDAEQTRAPDRARESLMDANPWTYWVMAQEMIREGQVESPSDPTTSALGDQRTYLYIEIKKTTNGPNNGSSWVGAVVGVRLTSDPSVLYRSDHSTSGWAIQRDLPAATTVELPAGTTSADIASIEAIRTTSGKKDSGVSITMTAINRGFFLDANYLPRSSFVTWAGSITLTQAAPSATLWP